MVYLLIGNDSLSKDIKFRQIKQEALAKEVEQFNLDTVYSKELSLALLQERILCLPVKAKQRIILIKNAQDLKQDCREFIIRHLKKISQQIVLVLDINHYDRKDEFINQLSKFAKVMRFKEEVAVDAFTLSRSIALKKPGHALRLLNQLLREGERPERILGGLRYAWEREAAAPLELKRRLNLLLNCDIDIKTGRLKPVFALEKLVISLCRAG